MVKGIWSANGIEESIKDRGWIMDDIKLWTGNRPIIDN